MKIPISYSYRNLWTRRLTTLLTMLGIALVVFVFAAVLMLASGLRKTLVSTGEADNFVVLRKASTSDVLSILDRDSAKLIESFPEVSLGRNGKPLRSNDMVVIINLLKYGSNDLGNVIVRGVSPEALELRKQIKIIQGSSFSAGRTQVIVGKSIAKRFQGCNVGQTLKFGSNTWTIVGIFEAEKSGFESEIWADVQQMQAAFNRPVYSTTTVRLKNPAQLEAFKAHLAADPRLNSFEVKNEREYFAEQSEGLAKFIKVLGLVITIIFSFGAMIGAMITMYASVAHRTVEIGTLRSLGFHRRSILSAFLIEALLLSLIGGAIGLVFASYLQTVTISTLNFATFSELAFGFDLSVPIIIGSLLFAAAMGLIGGFLPAVNAARLNIVNALRSE